MDRPTILEYLKSQFFSEQIRSERLFTHEKVGETYVCALVNFDPLKVLDLIQYNARVATLITPFYKAIYIENDSLSSVFYCPQPDKLNLGFESYNQSIDSTLLIDLIQLGNKRNFKKLKHQAGDLLVACYDTYSELLGRIFDLNEEQMYRIKCINNYEVFLDNYLKIDSGETVGGKIHTDVFSWIYYIELKIVENLFENASNLIIHDVGSNTGNFPLMIAGLAQRTKMSFHIQKICCSDYNDTLLNTNLRSVEKSRGGFSTPIEIRRIDLLRDELPEVTDADVIFINDVIEHFEDITSKKIFHNLWKHTKNVLMVHVPIEETPSSSFGHFTNFTNEKLAAWASELPNCINLTDEFLKSSRFSNSPMLDGFLVLQRKQDSTTIGV